jgi:diaminopimelate epimerase
MEFHGRNKMCVIASASGNVFAFFWRRDLEIIQPGLPFDGSEAARRICPRGHGLGLDGIFLLDVPKKNKPWVIEHWDADGSRSFCSNGTRAATALLPDEFQGLLEVCSTDETVMLDRRGADVGLRLPQGQGFSLMDAPDNMPFPAVYAWTGTPQLVLNVPDVDAMDMSSYGPPLRFHPELPFGANVSVLQVLSPGSAKIRTWERGVEAETLSCGQGAAAAAAWLAEQAGIKRWNIQPKGIDALCLDVGELQNRHWSELWLSGPVRILGSITLGPSLECKTKTTVSPEKGIHDK